MKTVVAGTAAGSSAAGQSTAPWYLRTYRWGQTNITEKDPERYDIAWWRTYWKRTAVQGVIINAGGIVAYYPSRFPLHRRAEFLRDRDLYGDLARAAHEDGLVVLARMDSNRASEDSYKEHPEWFAVNSAGEPYRAEDKYVTCINSPYYEGYLPDILREIIERSHPEGFADNSWSGLGRDSICYCESCARSFRDKAGHQLPKKHDWDSPGYRAWIRWSYARRLEIWDLNNRTTQKAGGPDCLWIGMNSGSVAGQSRSFRDYREICRRARIILLDHQSRSDTGSFQENTDSGLLIHGLLGWDKLIPESMAMYQAGRTSFRMAAKPAAEARLWMLAGFAGGIQPWWHHVGAYHEDRRMYRTAEPVMQWHKANEKYMMDRTPLATVGLVWSQTNTDFYGRDNPEALVDASYTGMRQALVRARIPYVPVHADSIDAEGGKLSVLILPNLAAMSDEQCVEVRRFVEKGGALVATGVSSLYTAEGDRRSEFALADLFGIQAGDSRPQDREWATRSQHTYLRLLPELRATVDGPRTGKEREPSGKRHAVLRGFEETDILPFGGMLTPLRLEAGRTVPMTFIPPFPIYPPETAWMREEKTDIPGLVLGTAAKGGRVAYLPADIDRRFSRDNLPDHGDLLANIVRWAAGDSIPLSVEGSGLIECTVFSQPGRMILHLVNLTSAGTWRAPIDEYIPVGPFQVRVKVPRDVKGGRLRTLVTGASRTVAVTAGWVEFDIPSIRDHEVAVVE